jgi:hypothetical protein
MIFPGVYRSFPLAPDLRAGRLGFLLVAPDPESARASGVLLL